MSTDYASHKAKLLLFARYSLRDSGLLVARVGFIDPITACSLFFIIDQEENTGEEGREALVENVHIL